MQIRRSVMYKEEEAIDLLMTNSKSSINIVNLGYLSRYIKSSHNPNNTFYMNGSMGACIPFSVGIALHSRKTVNCIIGDGAFIMNLESMLLLKSVKRKLVNLKIYLIDNGCHNSTGGQPTFSELIDFEKLSLAFQLDYHNASNQHELKICLDMQQNLEGPSLVHVNVIPLDHTPERINLDAEKIKEDFLDNHLSWII